MELNYCRTITLVMYIYNNLNLFYHAIAPAGS